MNEEHERQILEISEAAKRALSHHIGRPADSDSVDRMSSEIGAILGERVESAAVTASSLWSRMNWQTRVKWWVSNRLLKWVGRDVRAYHDAVRLMMAPADLDVYLSAMPVWANEDPKSVVVVDVKTRLPLPTNSIKFHVSIHEAQDQ